MSLGVVYRHGSIGLGLTHSYKDSVISLRWDRGRIRGHLPCDLIPRWRPASRKVLQRFFDAEPKLPVPQRGLHTTTVSRVDEKPVLPALRGESHVRHWRAFRYYPSPSLSHARLRQVNVIGRPGNNTPDGVMTLECSEMTLYQSFCFGSPRQSTSPWPGNPL